MFLSSSFALHADNLSSLVWVAIQCSMYSVEDPFSFQQAVCTLNSLQSNQAKVFWLLGQPYYKACSLWGSGWPEYRGGHIWGIMVEEITAYCTYCTVQSTRWEVSRNLGTLQTGFLYYGCPDNECGQLFPSTVVQARGGSHPSCLGQKGSGYKNQISSLEGRLSGVHGDWEEDKEISRHSGPFHHVFLFFLLPPSWKQAKISRH